MSLNSLLQGDDVMEWKVVQFSADWVTGRDGAVRVPSALATHLEDRVRTGPLLVVGMYWYFLAARGVDRPGAAHGYWPAAAVLDKLNEAGCAIGQLVIPDVLPVNCSWRRRPELTHTYLPRVIGELSPMLDQLVVNGVPQ